MAIMIEWGAVVGIVGVAITIVGGAVARDRQLVGMVNKAREDAKKDQIECSRAASEQLSVLRGVLSEKYVRRADLDNHVVRLEKQIASLAQDMKEERRETNARLDVILSTVQGRNISS